MVLSLDQTRLGIKTTRTPYNLPMEVREIVLPLDQTSLGPKTALNPDIYLTYGGEGHCLAIGPEQVGNKDDMNTDT